MSDESKPYASLTVAERWVWHARIYAFRRIVLRVPHAEHTSPVDPQGIWFDEPMIAEAMRRLRAELDARRGRAEPFRSRYPEAAE